MGATFDLSEILKTKSDFTKKELVKYAWALSIPAIFAQISSILMQYIDTAMVGKIGQQAVASIALVAPLTWVIMSFTQSISLGFTILVSHSVGAGKKQEAKHILIQSVIISLFIDAIVVLFSCGISKAVPVWLHGESEIQGDASVYFFFFALSVPLYQTVYLLSGMLQSSGDMKTPGILNTAMCLLDIVFNYIFIFGFKMGVKGAAIGSAFSALTVALIIFYRTFFCSRYFSARHNPALIAKKPRFPYFLDLPLIKKAFKLAAPIALQRVAFTGALVAVTRIIAPLGAASLAANSFAVTAESLCYMPGYGLEGAAQTLVGQSIGARRKDLARRFSWITIFMGIAIMSAMGVVMYFICPAVFAFLTPSKEIQKLSIKILRLELWAEPFYAASIVASGALRGSGDTLVPSILNLFSIWVVRISLSLLLVTRFALPGIWIAMAVELCFRGIIFIIRTLTTRTIN